MEPYKRDFFIARIQAGCVPVNMGGIRYVVNHPTVDINLLAQEKYLEAYEQAQDQELMADDDLLDFLIKQGIWSNQREEEYQRIVPGHIEYWKIELYQSALKANTRKKMRQYLQVAKEEYNKLHDIRHCYDYVTVDGYANFVRSMYVISECTMIDGEKVDWDCYSLTKFMGHYHQSLILPEDVRELARTSPWNNLWSTLKASGKIFNVDYITPEQQSLLSWSIMYDKIYESPDCPTEEVIEDDDMLDGWLLLQKRKRDADKKQQEVEGAISSKMKNADEIFIPVETAEDAQKIDLLNPQHVKNIKKQRMKQIEKQGTVKEQEFKDVQLKRSMQLQEAYNQHVKGR